VAQQILCQSDKWLWSYESKQQLFCSWGGISFFYKKLILNFYYYFFLKDQVFIFIGRLDSSHSNMGGDKYGEFHFAGSSGISLQILHMKFVFEPNFYNFEYLVFSVIIHLMLVNISFENFTLA
jgi:hypothetical protein